MRPTGGKSALVLLLTPMLVSAADTDDPSPAERIEAETRQFVAQCLDLPDPVSCIVEHGYQCLSISDSDAPKLSCMRRYREGAVILTVSQTSGTWSGRFSWDPGGGSHRHSNAYVDAKLARLLKVEDDSRMVGRLMQKGYSQSDSQMIADTAFQKFANCLVGAMQGQAAQKRIPPDLVLMALESKLEYDEYRLEDLLDWPSVLRIADACKSRVLENIGLLSQ
jgi:hypothetical protein